MCIVCLFLSAASNQPMHKRDRLISKPSPFRYLHTQVCQYLRVHVDVGAFILKIFMQTPTFFQITPTPTVLDIKCASNLKRILKLSNICTQQEGALWKNRITISSKQMFIVFFMV